MINTMLLLCRQQNRDRRLEEDNQSNGRMPLNITKLIKEEAHVESNTPRMKFKCNRITLWEGFNRKWPAYGKQFKFQMVEPNIRSESLNQQNNRRSQFSELSKKIEEKQRLLEEIYMPRQTRSITQPNIVRTPNRKSHLQIRTLDTPKESGKISQRIKSANIQCKQKKRMLRPKAIPLGLNVSKCNISDRTPRMRVQIDYHQRPASDQYRRQGQQINTPKYQPKLSIPLTKWEYSEVSFDF